MKGLKKSLDDFVDYLDNSKYGYEVVCGIALVLIFMGLAKYFYVPDICVRDPITQRCPDGSDPKGRTRHWGNWLPAGSDWG